jgi:hypothetical protein
MLRTHLETSKKPVDLDEILEVFPAAWEKRRALSAIVRSGLIGLDELLKTVAQLETSQEEFWVVSSVIGSGRFDEKALHQLGNAVRFPAGQRLIRRQLAKMA